MGSPPPKPLPGRWPALVPSTPVRCPSGSTRSPIHLQPAVGSVELFRTEVNREVIVATAYYTYAR